MDKVKLEDFKCISGYRDENMNVACGKIPNPGDKIYSCHECPQRYKYRCETCFTKNGGHSHFGREKITLTFEPLLTKLVSEHFTLACVCDENQKCNYFCSNSKNGCEEEFLALKAHKKSCIYQQVPCPSMNCKEVIIFKDVNDHMEQSHKLSKVNKEWNFEGAKEDLNEIICSVSSYDQKFFPQAFVKENQFHFKVIMLNHQVNAIPFDVNMTFFLEDGKNFSMKNRVYPVSENDKTNNFLKFPLKQITEYFDSKAMELKRQPKIDFCLKIVNEKMDEIAKEKNQNVESGNL